MWCFVQKRLHESCRMGRRIDADSLICSLGHCECDGHKAHKLIQRRLTADWLALQESDCSRVRCKVSSDCLPNYIKVTRPVLEIFKMAGYFPDRPRILPCSQEPAATSYLSQIQPVCTVPISIRTILISPSHLRLRLSSSFLTSAYQPRKFDTKPVRIRSKFMLYLYKCELLLEDMNNNFGTTIVPYNALSKYSKYADV